MSVISATPDLRLRLASDVLFRREHLYAQMALVRRFDQRVLELFDSNELFGTTHCSIGQEANAVGVLNHLEARDIVWSSHRCHAHFLAWCDQPHLLMAELMGRATGVCGGRGGSQQLCYKNFYSNGVQGGIVPTAVGMALAEKMKNTAAIAVVFLGDGTLGEGAVYEALNMASLWSVPILFVLENNRWAQSTPVEKELAGSMVARAQAFGIESGEIDSTDAEVLFAHFAAIVDRVRAARRPHFEVIHTYRLCHHSRSDDMRPQDEVERFRAGDPLPLLRSRLPEEAAQRIEREAARRVQDAVSWARSQPFPELPSHNAIAAHANGARA